MVFVMLHKIQVILFSLWITDGALQEGGSIFENGESIKCSQIPDEGRRQECEGKCGSCAFGDCMNNGRCDCYSGWWGPLCRKICPAGSWGLKCIRRCNCQNGEDCDARYGMCNCKEGWKGNDCSEPCSEGHFGNLCKRRCQCKNNATCDRFTGRCNCTAGYQGPLCEEKCPVGSHGYRCTDECKCQNDATCHHVDGSCECPAGWTGPVCAEECPERLFGINCSEECNCYNNAPCHFITGECICAEGYYGESCEIRCLSKDWGIDHSQGCSCEDAECSTFIGNCSCLPGFYGRSCHVRTCPPARWGYRCTKRCNCSNGDSCHPITGECCSQVSLTGNCSADSEAYFPKQNTEKTGSCSAFVVPTIVCVSVIVLLLIAVGIFYCTRRLKEVSEANGGSSLFQFAALTNNN